MDFSLGRFYGSSALFCLCQPRTCCVHIRVAPSDFFRLSTSITTINSQISTGNIQASIRQQESDRTHQIFRSTHLTHRNQTCPGLVELCIFVQNLPCQGREHVARRDTVDSNVSVRPLNRTGCSKMSHCGFCCIVGCLWLRNIDDGTRHGANEDHRAGCCVSFHEVFCNACSEEVCAVYVDAPELLHPFVGVGDGVVVLGKAGAGDQMINLAVLANDIGKGGFDGGWV